jgi:hypothetical protein
VPRRVPVPVVLVFAPQKSPNTGTNTDRILDTGIRLPVFNKAKHPVKEHLIPVSPNYCPKKKKTKNRLKTRTKNVQSKQKREIKNTGE